MQPVLRGREDRRAGHVHHRSVRRHDARRSRRRRDQDRKSRRRSLPGLPGRLVLAAFPGLQPQQAKRRLRSQATRRSRAVRPADPRRGRLHPELSSGHRRKTRRGRGAAARAQSETRLLLHQRVRRQRAVCRTAQLRFGCPGLVGFPERGGRRRPAAVPRAGAGGCDHRHLCRVRRARSAARARRQRPRQAGGSVDARSDGAFRRRAFRRVFCAGRRAEVGGSPAPRAGLHPAHLRQPAHRDPPVVAGKILAGTRQGARGG